MVAKRTREVRIHTFVASFAYNNIANATHIVETRNQLVLVDSQFLVPYARAFRDYADSLGKPIERLYVSHRHPDHWFGDRKSTRLNSSHESESRMPSSA